MNYSHLYHPRCDPVTEPDLPKLGKHEGEVSQGSPPFCCTRQRSLQQIPSPRSSPPLSSRKPGASA